MSWLKKRGQPANQSPIPSTMVPPVQMYDPNQHSKLQVSSCLNNVLMLKLLTDNIS